MAQEMGRLPRVAFMLLKGLDHFAPELLAGLAASGRVEARGFYLDTRTRSLDEAMAWADDPGQDSLWFEFCWPPFPELIARTDFGGRRVVMRVHRIEAYGSPHAASAPWHKVDDAIVVGEDMARRLHAAAPKLAATTRVHVVHNGLDLGRYAAATAPDPFRIGWCGWLSLHKNPNLALEVLHRLLQQDPRYTLHVATQGGDAVAADSFAHLARRMGVAPAVHVLQGVPQQAMPEWHAKNGVLLSTSVYESFGYAIAEAAAVGCDLAILDNTAAGEFWPAETLFGTVDEAVAIIRQAAPHRWRAHVEARFGLDRQVAAVCDILAQRTETLSSLAGSQPANGPRLVPIGHANWRGRFVVHDTRDHIQNVVAQSGRFYEAEMLQDIQSRLPPGGVFVDVGANIGNHTLFAAAVCQAQVLAFEPSPGLARHCAENLAANGVDGRVQLRQAGVSDHAGMAQVHPGPTNNAGMTQLKEGGEKGIAEVPLVSLDEEIARLGLTPQVIKVDVEGMEVPVLRGAGRVLRQHRPALYVEAATTEHFMAVNDILAPLGYEAVARFNATPTYLFLPQAA